MQYKNLSLKELKGMMRKIIKNRVTLLYDRSIWYQWRKLNRELNRRNLQLYIEVDTGKIVWEKRKNIQQKINKPFNN